MGQSDRLLREDVINLRKTPTEYQDPLFFLSYLQVQWQWFESLLAHVAMHCLSNNLS